MPVSQAFLTSHFFVDCGDDTTFDSDSQYCFYDASDNQYYTSPTTVIAYDGADWLECYGDAADFRTHGGLYECTDNTGRVTCEDKTSIWTTNYQQAANVQYINGAYVTNPDGTQGTLGCDVDDQTTYQIFCHAQSPTDTDAIDTNGYAYCAPDSSRSYYSTSGTWFVAFYDANTCQNTAAATVASIDFDSQYCGDASTVTQSVFVMVISLVAALKAVL